MPHFRRSTAAALVCLIIVVAGCASPAVDPAKPTATLLPNRGPTTYAVQRGRVVRTLTLDGRVAPIDETALHFASSGYVRQVYVQQGEQVSEGDLLAELEIGNLGYEIARAEGALASAQQALAEGEQLRKQRIAAAELDLQVAETKLTEAEEARASALAQAELALQLEEGRLARLEALSGSYDAEAKRALANLEYARAQARAGLIEASLAQRNTTVAQAEYEQAQANQSAHAADIDVQKLVVRQAEEQVAHLEKSVSSLLELEVQRTQEALDVLKGQPVDAALLDQAKQAELSVERLREQLGAARIYSPVEGQVVSLLIYPGIAVEPYQTALVIADPSQLEGRVPASDEQLRLMYEGQQVNVSLRADSSQAYETTIRCLPYPYGACGDPNDTVGSEQVVRIALGDDAGPLQMGALIHVTLALEERDDVLWLPTAAIRTFQEQSFVMVAENDGQRRANVTLGISGQGRVEILNGLTEGQVVVAP